MTSTVDKEPFELFLQFSRSESGDETHVVPKETLEYQRTDLDGGKVSTASLPWDSKNIKNGLAELQKENPKKSAFVAFGDELLRFLRDCRVDTSLKDAYEAKRPIRITIRSAAAELYVLPWELTRLEDANKELAQIADCTIRYTWPTTSKRTIISDSKPQPEGGRILFAWSHGDDSVPWNSHVNAIESACAAMSGDEKQRRDFFQRDIDMVPHATFKEIYSKIEHAAQEGRPYSIVHLLCHGGMLEGDDGVGLVLTDDDDRKRGLAADGHQVNDIDDLEKVTVSPDTLATLFDGADDQKPQIMVLCACLGSAMDPASHLGSVALAIHRTGIKSVIASRFLLSKPGSMLLAESMYHSLLGRSDSPPTSVENAVRVARTKLRVENSTTSDYAAIQLFQNTTGWDTRPVVFRPYRGLRSFRQEDAPLFFGRTREIEEACNDLGTLIQSGKPRLFMVIGASGTGKSSLVFAGIIPRLQKDRKDKAPWLDVTIRARDGVQAVEDACKQATNEKKDLLLVVDQFEEIFTDIGDEATRNAFVQKLLDVTGDKESVGTVIATLRSDFLNRCGDVPIGNGKRLDAVVNDKDHQVFVSLMERSALQDVIKGPASWTGIALDEMLVQQILNDAGEEPGALPLLQNTLDDLWQNRVQGSDGRYALSKNYDKLTTALVNKADSIVDAFQAQEKKDTAKRILVQLVDMRDDASPYTRRRVLKDELRKGRVGKDVFHEVLEKLTTENLVVQSEMDGDKRAIVEISHEQIVRSWLTLGVWLKEERQRLVDMGRFEKWIETATKDETYVLQGGELALAIELRTKYENDDVLGEKELNLIRKSEDDARKRKEALAAVWRKARENALMAGARENLSKRPHLSTLLLVEVAEPEKTRGWMQLALDRSLANGTLFSTRRHEARLNNAAWSPDGKRFVTTSDDGTARIWNADGSGEPVLLVGHEDKVNCALWSPDNTRIVTTSDDGTARVWNADGSGFPIVLKGHQGTVRFAAWSPDSKRIVTVADDNTARVWNADVADKPVVLAGHEDTVRSTAWSPDGKRIVTASRDKTAQVWNADGLGNPVTFKGHADAVVSAAWSPDGKRIVSASNDKTAQVWNADGSGKPVILKGHVYRVNSAAWSPDGRYIVTAGDDTARVWNADGSDKPVILDGHENEVICAAWSPDGRRIVTASDDTTARVWNADGSGQTVVLAGHENKVKSAVWSHDALRILTASTDKTARVWNVDSSATRVVLNDHQDLVHSAAWSPDATRVATASSDKTARVWNADGSGTPVVLTGHEKKVRSVAWSPDGKRLVTASDDKTARVWNVDGSGTPVVLKGHDDEVRSAAWNPDGTHIVTASDDTTARVWNADGSGTPLVLAGHQDAVHSAAWSPDGTRIVTASADSHAHVWNVAGSDKPLLLEGHEAAVHSAAWSPDGTRIITASDDTTVRVWNADGSGKPVLLVGHEGAVKFAAWSPDGKHIVTASEDRTARVWSADGSGDPFVFKGHEFEVNSAAWSPDGKRIVTASWDRTAQVWRFREIPQLQETLRNMTTDCLTADERQTYLLETPEEARVHYEENEHAHGRTPDVDARTTR